MCDSKKLLVFMFVSFCVCWGLMVCWVLGVWDLGWVGGGVGVWWVFFLVWCSCVCSVSRLVLVWSLVVWWCFRVCVCVELLDFVVMVKYFLEVVCLYFLFFVLVSCMLGFFK